MTLEERLRLLKGETAPPAPPSDLAARLRRLASGPSRREAHHRPDEPALATAIGGEQLDTGLIRVERKLDLDHWHGGVRLRDALVEVPFLHDGANIEPGKCLFLDTETSGLAGGTGTWAFLFGAVRLDDGALIMRQYLLSRLDAEAAYLEAVERETEQAQVLVSYNGKAFDAPLLATRFRLSGVDSSLDAKAHLDLLALVRRVFGRVWPDCRLVTAERRLLGYARSGDLPGAEAPQAWLAWLRQGDSERLCGVLAHNRRDLMSLLGLASPLARSLRDPAATGAEIGAVARYHLARGDEARAFALLAANRSLLAPPAFLDLARLHRGRGEWAAACRIWEALAEQGEAAAIEALAKHREHRLRDYGAALDLARRLPAGPERERRCCRLEARLAVTVRSRSRPRSVSSATPWSTGRREASACGEPGGMVVSDGSRTTQ
ncbi:MAG: ribonuclease H-like domain-containing protein [Chromatiaceae bacterium]